MTLENLEGLSQDEQFEKAAEFAGVPASVLRSMWKVESGEGKNMLSPAGAEGHFQIMPETRATWEGRLGKKLDPYSFEDALVLAAYTMRENMQLANGDLPNALRWYNAGNPSRWDNPETREYVTKVLGNAPDVDASAYSVEGMPAPTSEFAWETSAYDLMAQQNKEISGGTSTPVLNALEKGLVSQAGLEAAAATLLNGGEVEAAASAAREAREVVRANPAEVADAVASNLAERQTGTGSDGAFAFAQAQQAGGEEVQAELESWTGWMKFGAALDSNALFTGIARWMERDAPKPDPSFNYMDHIDELERGRSFDEIEGLREARSLAQAKQILERQDQLRENARVLGANAGTAEVLGWNLLGGLADPVGFAAGAGVGKLFQLGGIGSRAAFESNKIGRGFALAGLEGSVGNLGFSAALDAMGEHQTTNAYAQSAGFGFVLGSAFGAVEWRTSRGTAAMNELRALGEEYMRKAAERDAKLVERAAAEAGPGATAQEIADIAKRLDAEDMQRMQAVMLGQVPEDRRLSSGNMEAEVEADVPAPAASAPTVRLSENGVVEFNFRDSEIHRAPAEHAVEIGGETYDRRIVEAWYDSLTEGNVRPVLAAIADMPDLRADYRGLAKKLAAVAEKSGLVPDDGRIARTYGNVNRIGGLYMPQEHAVFLRNYNPDIVLHEVIHAFTHRELLNGTPQNAKLVRLMNHTRNFLRSAEAQGKEIPFFIQTRLDKDAASYPLQDVSEFVAYGMTDPATQMLLKQIPAPAGYPAGYFKNAWDWLVDTVREVLGLDPGDRSVLTELLEASTSLIDDTIRPIEASPNMAAAASTPGATPAAATSPLLGQTPVNQTRSQYLAAARRYGLDKTIPDDAERKLLAEMFTRAEIILERNPIDVAKLNPLLEKVGWEATSGRLLKSNNPVLRAFALIALENPEGAVARAPTAAIMKQMLYHTYRGDADIQFRSMYAVWRDRNGGSAVRDFYDEKLWRRFNREVYAERDRRWNEKAGPAVSAEVKHAADVLDAAYHRMGKDQVFAQTIGSQRINPDRLGYQPRMMSPGMVGNMTDAQISAYLQVISREFQHMEGFDKAFADKFAREYLSRVRTEAKGAYDVPATLHDPAGADHIRESLKAMGMTQQEIVQVLERVTRGGASHTKARLEADLTALYDDGNGGNLQMMDLMITDNLYLLNKYAHRVAGEVSLAKFGVLGEAGLKLVRRAAEVGPDNMRATVAELEAFDQVAAEFLGRPFGTHLGKWADNARALTSALRLGGMGFNQLNEYANGVAALGVGRVFGAIKAMPRLLGEVRRAARGERVNNPILDSLDVYGGRIGAADYQLKGMWDVNESFEVYGVENLTVLDKAIRAGQHANRVLSGHRAITAIQTRGMAEQIVMKALRYMREGREDVALLDMGFTPEIRAGMLADLDRAAVFDANGELVSFDITKITDDYAANGFMTAVHRGASQIIQQAYVGETGKWAHDGWLRLLTQFRTYGLTATQKQWRRQAFTYGTTKALMYLLGAMSVAIPIHLARVQLRALNREDRDEFIDRETSPLMLARATLNYVAAAGLLPDVLDVGSAMTGGAITGGRAGNMSPVIGGQILPAAGVANAAYKAAVDKDPHQMVKLLPGANLPYLQGAINLLDE